MQNSRCKTQQASRLPYFGIRSSMALFFSSLFSMLMRRLTPSITLWTSCTSEKPRRSELEMSKVLPTAAVSTPPEKKKATYDIQYVEGLCWKLKEKRTALYASSYQFRVSAISVYPEFRQILNPGRGKMLSFMYGSN